MDNFDLVAFGVGVIYLMIGFFVASLVCDEPEGSFGLILMFWPVFVAVTLAFVVICLAPMKLAFWIKKRLNW